jgi:hypothetical protein
MSPNQEHWWEDSQNAALVIVALVVAILVLGFVADWTVLRLIDSEEESYA